MRNIARRPGAFVIAIFDCCREQLKLETRGLGQDEGQDNELGNLDDSEGSLIMLFACEAGKRADAVSSVATQFFTHLKDKMDKKWCRTILPDALNIGFNLGNNGEYIPKCKRQLAINYPNAVADLHDSDDEEEKKMIQDHQDEVARMREEIEAIKRTSLLR